MYDRKSWLTTATYTEMTETIFLMCACSSEWTLRFWRYSYRKGKTRKNVTIYPARSERKWTARIHFWVSGSMFKTTIPPFGGRDFIFGPLKATSECHKFKKHTLTLKTQWWQSISLIHFEILIILWGTWSAFDNFGTVTPCRKKWRLVLESVWVGGKMFITFKSRLLAVTRSCQVASPTKCEYWHLAYTQHSKGSNSQITFIQI